MRRMQLAAACVVALGTTAIGATSAAAQAPAIPSPFHAGQWAIEGYAAGQTGGVMRFFTPRTALALTLSADHLDTRSDDASSTLVSSKSTTLDVTLGLRRHTMLASKVAGTFGIGAVGGTVKRRQEYTIFSPDHFHSGYYGAFADLGGQYMVADHFAVGVAYRFVARHVSNSGSHQAGTELATGVLPIRATLYF